METYNQPTSTPTQKVAAGGIGGALSIVLIYVVGLLGLDMPPEVASAVTAIVSFLAGYIVKERVPTVGDVAEAVKKDMGKRS